MSHIVIGTAGHIDHGKTALVKALTGMETDRLKEEREREITIDIGFAFLGDNVTIIDVPGHERFIKNMVAGVSTIDFVILVIAADDGIMPQTREHLDILRLLKVNSGMVALTKAEMVDREWLQLVQEEIADYLQETFLEGCPILPVDSLSGQGIPEFGEELQQQLAGIDSQHRDGIYREFIDRVFSVKGHGTVVTGTVISGKIAVGEDIDILPEGKTVRVRGIQIHGENVKKAALGDRAALNLQGVDVEQLERGQVLTAHDVAQGSYMLDVRLSLLESARPLKDRARVRLHIGTAEVMARVRLLGRPDSMTTESEGQAAPAEQPLSSLEPGGEVWAQLTLEKQVAAIREDRFVIRSYSPQVTIGGGRVLNPLPAGKRKQNLSTLTALCEMEAANRREVLSGLMQAEKKAGWTAPDLVARTGYLPTEVASILNELVQEELLFRVGRGAGALFISTGLWQSYQQQISDRLTEFHRDNSHQPGISLAQLRKVLSPPLPQILFDGLMQSLAEQKALFMQAGKAALPGHETKLDSRLEEKLELLLAWICEPGNQLFRLSDLNNRFPELPAAELKELLGIMVQNKQIVRISNDYMGEAAHMDKLQVKLREALDDEGMTISQIGELFGTARRLTVPLMEYFDSVKLTYRIGNIRKLN